jgi:hypothetical protein
MQQNPPTTRIATAHVRRPDRDGQGTVTCTETTKHATKTLTEVEQLTFISLLELSCQVALDKSGLSCNNQNKSRLAGVLGKSGQTLLTQIAKSRRVEICRLHEPAKHSLEQL